MKDFKKAAFVTATLLGICSFINNEYFHYLIIIKLTLLAATLMLVAQTGTGGGFLKKIIQVVIEDVRSDRIERYRELLVEGLGWLGNIRRLPEAEGQVGIYLEGNIAPEDVYRQIERCKIKAQHTQTTVLLRYTSLEVTAEAVIMINAVATPDSILKVDGLSENIKVGNAGTVSIKIPSSLYKRNIDRGYISAVCIKGSLREIIQIKLH